MRELDKGVSAVVGLATAHPAARGFSAPARPRPAVAAQAFAPPLVQEMLCVTAPVLPLFPHLRSVPAGARVAGPDLIPDVLAGRGTR